MSEFEQRASLGVGIVLLVVFAGVLWVGLEGWSLEQVAVTPTTVASAVAGLTLLLGGLAFVIAGLRERVSVAGRTVGWWDLFSLGFVFLGAYMAISGLVQSADLSMYALLTVGAGVAFAAVGIQHIRHGRPEDREPSTRQVATILVGTMAVLVGLSVLMLWSA
ncbi:hypothetical protein [Natrarchaeobaculum aegyptiacum]|uniref:Uncharacterized protein n=1 Tax=Natrarchaeobaculum aegyptiacum TaxID=745377 RepID=A0A2Z2HTL1_9EURY|nr:hypothetical protein [Natrarchaeobaculum aegyptiacum]ARS90576.1 hypothetical protein B1756_13145 [Natrarchaeobaculum aegyptiacum]